MTGHEQKSLAQQLLRCYGANKKHRSPLSLHLTAVGLARSQFPACLPPPEHLARWERDEFVAIMDPPANALWPGSTLCWLSPDAEETLEAPLKDNAVYVLGGLVDRSVDKGQSLSRALESGAIARRFPVREFAPRKDVHPILALPACVEILADIHGGASWADAFAAAVPKRYLHRRALEEAQRVEKSLQDEREGDARRS